MRDWNSVREHLCADITDLKEHLQMLLQFSGRMVHLQDLRRVKQLTSFFMADIQQFLLDMQDFVSVHII